MGVKFHTDSFQEKRWLQQQSNAITERYFIDASASNTTYYGFALKLDSLTSESEWKIIRKTVDGTMTYYEFANEEDKYDKVWDSRSIYFGASPAGIYASMAFDGSNDSVLFASGVYNLLYDQTFGISFWVRFGTLTNEQTMISCSGTNVGWQITKVNTTNLLRFRMCNTATTNDLLIVGNTAMLVNTWYHIVISKTGATSALTNMYINGVLQTNTITANTLSASPSYAGFFLQFGARGSSSYTSGFIDNVLFSNAEITQTQVTELYNGGSGILPASYSDYANTASAWKLGESPDTTGAGGVYDQKLLYNGTMTNMLLTNIVGSYPGGPV
jgi:hypothetical protein